MSIVDVKDVKIPRQKALDIWKLARLLIHISSSGIDGLHACIENSLIQDLASEGVLISSNGVTAPELETYDMHRITFSPMTIHIRLCRPDTVEAREQGIRVEQYLNGWLDAAEATILAE